MRTLGRSVTVPVARFATSSIAQVPTSARDPHLDKGSRNAPARPRRVAFIHRFNPCLARPTSRVQPPSKAVGCNERLDVIYSTAQASDT